MRRKAILQCNGADGLFGTGAHGRLCVMIDDGSADAALGNTTLLAGAAGFGGRRDGGMQRVGGV